jgi:CubicO group peptidase (beta-lactamase class C family)
MTLCLVFALLFTQAADSAIPAAVSRASATSEFSPSTATPLAPVLFTPALPADAVPTPPLAIAAPPGFAPIDRAAFHGLVAGGYPGMAVIIGRRDSTLLARGYGHRDWAPNSGSVDPARTLYDLASLTKVVATTAAAMVLYDRGQLDLDAHVSRYLPGWGIKGRSTVTVRDLLMHRSGLPAGRELWRVAHSPAAARRAVLATPLEYRPGSHFVYSDIGADVLGFVIEAIAHEPLNVFVARNVYRPLGMHYTEFRPPTTMLSQVARTEAPSGRVLDRNAAVLGGVAGHAGLFASATDLAIFSRMMLGGGTYHGVRLVRPSTVAVFTQRAGGGANGTRALGWDTCGGGASCGQYMGPRAYGHTGYTGTSIWIDPEHDLFVIVLANWASGTPTHPAGPSAILADVRADVADLAVAMVSPPDPTGVAVPHVPSPAMVALRSDGARGWSRGPDDRSW